MNIMIVFVNVPNKFGKIRIRKKKLYLQSRQLSMCNARQCVTIRNRFIITSHKCKIEDNFRGSRYLDQNSVRCIQNSRR